VNKLLIVVLAAGAAVAGQASAANLLVNGDFETPATPNGGYTIYGGGDSFTGWSVTGPAGNAVLQLNTNYTEPNITFPAESGLTSMDLTGAGNTGPTSGVNQSVATVLGKTYNLSFWVGNADGSGNGNYTLPSTVDLSIDGGALQPFTNSNITHFSTNWELFTTSFVANGASTNIAFLNGTGLADAETGLDNVSLTTAGVPEPASWALMLTGVFGLGAVLRVNRRSASRLEASRV
jgi:hypothetical protein